MSSSEPLKPPRVDPRNRFWFARQSKSINFLVLILSIVGIYEAFSVPIAVFPTTNFPRIIVGVDNGVMPIDQMEVTITQPLENAVNSVPGLQDVRSTTSRGLCRNRLVLRLGRGHRSNPAAGKFRRCACPEQPPVDGTD